MVGTPAADQADPQVMAARHAHLGLRLDNTSGSQANAPLSPPPTQASTSSTVPGSAGRHTHGVSGPGSLHPTPVPTSRLSTAMDLSTRRANPAISQPASNLATPTPVSNDQDRRARIEQLEIELASLRSLIPEPVLPSVTVTAPGEAPALPTTSASGLNSLSRLFENEDTLLRIKEVFSASKEDQGRKGPLPVIVPGFKASSLDLRKSPPLLLRATCLSGYCSPRGVCCLEPRAQHIFFALALARPGYGV